VLRDDRCAGEFKVFAIINVQKSNDRVTKEIVAAARGTTPRPVLQPTTLQARANPGRRVGVGTVEPATH